MVEDSTDGRPMSNLPRRAAPAAGTGSIKVPLLSQLTSSDEIALALANRDPGLLTAALIQIEKRASALVSAGEAAPEDPVAQYLARYPAADGVYSAFDYAHKTNNSPLSATCLTCLTSMIRLVSLDPYANDPPLLRRLLSTTPGPGYGAHLDRALNPGRNDVTVAALKLLNVVVGFGQGRYARRLFALMSWSPKITSRLFRTRLRDSSHPLSKPSIRTLLQMLVLSLLSTQDARLKSQVLETKGLVSGVIKGLNEDHEDIVRLVLEVVWTDVVKERKIGLEARRNVFEESVVAELAKLYEVSGDEPASPRTSIDRFFRCINSWLSTQINDSPARSFGPQRVLSLVLRNLKVTDDAMQRTLALEILSSAPILCTQFWARFPSSLDPRLSSRWISAITFVTQAVSVPVSVHINATQAPPTAQSLLDTIVPPSLNRVWLTKAIQNTNELVSFLSALCLLASMQKAAKVLEAIAQASVNLEEGPGGRWAELGHRIRDQLKDRAPDAQVIVALLAKSAAPATAAKDSTSNAHHLRHTLALRLLYLYHRVAPASILSLKFDFAKLPLQHVTPTGDAEGLRAIASAYSLRLASVHTVSGASGAAAAGWARPGDYFRSTLAPLFQLYRTPSTQSNQTLLLGILGRLLVASPVLFGPEDFIDDEVQVWLQALPAPGKDESTLAWFEGCVRKTFITPSARSADPSQVQSPALSPLLKTVLSELPLAIADAQSDQIARGYLNLITQAFYNYVGAVQDLALLRQIKTAFEKVLEGSTSKAVRTFLQNLTVCMSALEGKADAHYGLGSHGTWSSHSTAYMMVHATSDEMQDAELLALVTSRHEQTRALRTVLHRFLAGQLGHEEHIDSIVAFVTSVVDSAADDRLRLALKQSLLGEKGLLSAFRREDAQHQAIAKLVASILEPSRKQDADLAQPFCELIAADALRTKTSKKSKSNRLGPASACAAMIEFLDADTTLSVLDHLLSQKNATADASLLSVCLQRAARLTPSVALVKVWSAHFDALLQMHLNGNDEIGRFLALGAQTLLPFSDTEVARSTEDLWKPYLSSWSAHILTQSSLSPSIASALAAFIYRSADSRTAFVKWLDGVDDDSLLRGAELPLEALLEVSLAKTQPVSLPSKVLARLVDQVLKGDNAQAALRILALARQNTADSSSLESIVAQRLTGIERDEFTSDTIRLAEVAGSISTLAGYVNATFAGITRRVVDDDLDEEVLALVGQITSTAQQHSIEYKSHLLDPLIMAVCTHRLELASVIEMAAALVQTHKWSSNEPTRHLNAIFANPQFRPRPDSELDVRAIQDSIVKLVIALSRSSTASAAATGVIDKLVPFYRGTLSPNDQSILALARKIEYTTEAVVSPALSNWNPTVDSSPLEPSRLAALGALQPGHVRRACLRACASSQTQFPSDHDSITYDPVFLLSFVAQAAAHDEFKLSDWLAVLETGALSIAVAALASSQSSMRLVARATVQLLLKKLETQSFIEKDEIVLVLTHAKNCVYSPAGEAIPSVIALFLANCLQILGTPESTLYPAFMRFLLQRAVLDQRDVPMFYIMFYSTSAEDSNEDHRWLLRFLTEGLVRTQDWRIYRRRQVYELVASLIQSNRNDPALRKLALQFFVRATSLPQVARELLSRNGILSWAASLSPMDAVERRLLLKIVCQVAHVVSGDKLPVVADVSDVLGVLTASQDVTSQDLAMVYPSLAQLVLRLPIASANSTLDSVLSRAGQIALTTGSRIPQDSSDKTVAASQIELYSLAMAIAFVRHEAGLAETRTSQQIFSLGVKAGLAAGSIDLRREVVASLAG